MNNTTTPLAAGLRRWAEGITCDSAAVELLIAFNRGTLLDAPWIRSDGEGSYWFDPAIAAAGGGYLSGGERRVLAVAMSLASSEHPVDLRDVLTGVDPKAFVLLVQAMGQAFGLATDTEPPGSGVGDKTEDKGN